MSLFDEMEANYWHRRHFLQTVNLPAFEMPGKNFLYMKTHKAACTTVLATLMTQIAHLKGDTADISMETVHNPPNTLLLTGPRGLEPDDVTSAVQDKNVFKFTVIRDPLTRTVSAWADKIKSNHKQKARLMEHLGLPTEKNLTLKQFLEVLAKDEGARDLDRHWRPQRKEISYDQIDFDFIGTVETLEGDMAYISREIFGDAALPKLNDTRQSLGHKTSARELIDTLTARDMRHLERALGPDLEMYEAVQKHLGVAA